MADQNPHAGRHSAPPRTGGRVRSQDAHDAVLAAAAELLEEAGYQNVTIEGVAKRAGVAKSTIYRWWKSKPVLVMDAYRQTVEQRLPAPDTGGGLAEDLAAFLVGLYAVADHPLRAKALRGLMAEAQLDPDFAEPFREWVETRRAVVKQVLARAVERGELGGDVDLEYGADQVFGPFWYRLLVGHAPLDAAAAVRHAAVVLDGLRGRAAADE